MLVCTDSFFGRVSEADRAGDGGTSVGNGSLTFRSSVSLKFLKKIFIFYIIDITLVGEKIFCKIVWRNQNYHIHLQCTRSSEATFAGRRVKRESGANPEQFLLLCISTSIREVYVCCILCHWRKLGRRDKRDESEDLPVHLDDWYLQDTGVNQNLFLSLFF